MFHTDRLARMTILAGCIAILAGTANAQTSHPPAEAFGQLVEISEPQLSPDGKYFATIQSLKGRRAALIFDWEAQFLANRGYAVLQPNFSGSSGYGREFTAAGMHQWGLKMQDDVSDSIKKLIADGIADRGRICIVGADYGGYAALAGAALTPELYACAVSWAGVSDLPTQLGTAINNTGKESRAVQFWTSRIGSVYDDRERLNATSPAQHADNVKAPILLMHGDGDTTVHVNQSEIMEKALLKAGKTVEFIRFTGGEDHYLNLPATRIRMLKETERFLAKYIGN